MILKWGAELAYLGVSPLVRSWLSGGAATLPAACGDITYDQILAASRHGVGPQIQMHDGGSTVSGNVATYDGAGNTHDSGVPLASLSGGGGGSGTVTSVALTVPARQSVSGSPVTSSGTLAITDNAQSPNQVFAGPASGSAAAPGFRALVSADLPVATTSAAGAVKPDGTTITVASGVISAVSGFSPYPSSLSAPVSSNFTWLNQGSSAVTNKTGRMVMQIAPSSGNTPCLLYNTALPSTPYTIDAAFSISGDSESDWLVAAILLKNTGGSTMLASGINTKAGTPTWVLMLWNSASSFNSFTNNWGAATNPALCFVRITDDGTNRKYYISSNGKDFALVRTDATNTTITPNQTGFSFYNGTNSGTGIVAIYNFAVTPSILPQFA